MTRIRLEKPLRHEVRRFAARSWYTAREAGEELGRRRGTDALSPRRMREIAEERPLATKREPTPGGGKPSLLIAACCVEAEAVGELCECGGRAA